MSSMYINKSFSSKVCSYLKIDFSSKKSIKTLEENLEFNVNLNIFLAYWLSLYISSNELRIAIDFPDILWPFQRILSCL